MFNSQKGLQYYGLNHTLSAVVYILKAIHKHKCAIFVEAAYKIGACNLPGEYFVYIIISYDSVVSQDCVWLGCLLLQLFSS